MTQNEEFPDKKVFFSRDLMDARTRQIAEEHRLHIKNRRDGQTYSVPPLPEGVKLRRRDSDMTWMREAQIIALQSDDPSTQVGAVLVYAPNGRIQAKACNTLPPGVANHGHRRERPLKYKWTGHAEERLIAQCARLGIICDEAIVVVTHHPCSTCSRILIEAGISKIIYQHAVFGGDWADDIAIAREMLAEAGVEIRMIDEFSLDDL